MTIPCTLISTSVSIALILRGGGNKMINADERAELMVKCHGEVCKKSDAARILSMNPRTITAMLEDGRLQAACEGTRVDVRSIARYIATPAQVEEEGRIERLKRKYNSEWAV